MNRRRLLVAQAFPPSLRFGVHAVSGVGMSRCVNPSLGARSRPLEYPQIVLVSATTAELFHGSKATPAVLQFIAKADCHLTVRALDSPREHQRVPVPAQA